MYCHLYCLSSCTSIRTTLIYPSVIQGDGDEAIDKETIGMDRTKCGQRFPSVRCGPPYYISLIFQIKSCVTSHLKAQSQIIWHFLTFKVKSFQMKTRKCTSRDPQCTMLDIQAYGQQVSPDRHSIWIPNMLQSGSPDSFGDNECQACAPPLHAL